MNPFLVSITPKALRRTIDASLELLRSCSLCPRSCGVDRTAGETGFCRIGRWARVSSWTLHFGEEEVLVGTGGSGTIFFSGCNLGCVFCQNYEISHEPEGREHTPEELARLMIALQRQGAENINFVSPTHVVPQILESLPLAVELGLEIPLVYNCGGYESLETLKLLDGVIDIYMPDTKFWDGVHAERFCLAENYPERAKAALREMHRQVGDLTLDKDGVARQGLLVRHLLMPGGLAGTAEWVDFLEREISPLTYLNIMNQYRPCGEAHKFPELSGSVDLDEYLGVLEAARKAGMTRLDQGGFRRFERILRSLR
jgi:putative pyruvate formate lyase activating enzyme